MNAMPAAKEENVQKTPACRNRHGRQLIKTVMLVLGLGLAAWPAWNWVAVPLLTLPSLTYWQMTGIVALVGLITKGFNSADRQRGRSSGRTSIQPNWYPCRHALKNHQG